MTIAAAAVMLAALVPATAASAAWADERVVRNINSNLCMTFWSGTGERPVYQQSCQSGSLFQRWSIPVTLPSTDGGLVRYVQIIFEVPTGGYLCLAARGTGEANTVATTCDNGTGQWLDQYWAIKNMRDYFAIWNENSKLCLAARGTSTSRVIVSTCDFNAGQY